MRDRLTHLPADVWHWLADHKLAVGAACVALLVAGGIAAFLLTRDDDDDDRVAGAPAPTVLVREVPAPEEPEDLGFPEFATKNTTRVGGPDAITNAAAIALAVHPSTGGVESPPAVSLVAADDWPAAVAAAALANPEVGAPILLTERDDVPEITENTLRELNPEGSSKSAGRQAFVFGNARAPRGFDTLEFEGDDSATVAAQAARLVERLGGKPDHFVVVGLDNPALAAPAAAWAARSGDPVLFTERDEVPRATRDALSEHKNVPVFVLGPKSAVSDKTLDALRDVSRDVSRVGAADPVVNAIEFARFSSGGFGWDINDPGHGFVVASADRPMDAIVAAPLSASGTWGPLLLSSDPETLPAPLRGYLLDLKPGYLDDPTRAVYNHIWVIGDIDALSAELQAQLDEIAEVVPVSSGSGNDPALGPDPGTAEDEAAEDNAQRNRNRGNEQ